MNSGRQNWEFEQIMESGVWLIKAPYFVDHRGTFYEFFNEKAIFVALRHIAVPKFVETNFSDSYQNVIRGYHGDNKSWKYVGCAKGSIIIAIYMNDQDSQYYSYAKQLVLRREDNCCLLVPPKHGLCHLAWQQDSTLVYMVSEYYNRDSQFTLPYNLSLDFDWPVENPILSERDQYEVGII